MKCPGQDSRYWDGEAVFEAACARCGEMIEFFKDESARTCRNCGHRMLNPRLDFGCAAYCPYGEQCLGGMPDGLKAKKLDLLKERVALEMKNYFGADFKRIGHATRVARHAEEINESEHGNPAVVLIAAYLHGIGIKEAERRYDSAAPEHQHREGPAVARRILTSLNAEEELIAEVCDIVGHHHAPRSEETVNFKVLYDADLITNLEEQQQEQPLAPEGLARIIANSLLTAGGRQLAARVLTSNRPGESL
jgi:HD superfamily phosphohydrolase YqeK